MCAKYSLGVWERFADSLKTNIPGTKHVLTDRKGHQHICFCGKLLSQKCGQIVATPCGNILHTSRASHLPYDQKNQVLRNTGEYQQFMYKSTNKPVPTYMEVSWDMWKFHVSIRSMEFSCFCFMFHVLCSKFHSEVQKIIFGFYWNHEHVFVCVCACHVQECPCACQAVASKTKTLYNMDTWIFMYIHGHMYRYYM